MRDNELLIEYGYDRKQFFFQNPVVQFSCQVMEIHSFNDIWLTAYILL